MDKQTINIFRKQLLLLREEIIKIKEIEDNDVEEENELEMIEEEIFKLKIEKLKNKKLYNELLNNQNDTVDKLNYLKNKKENIIRKKQVKEYLTILELKLF